MDEEPGRAGQEAVAGRVVVPRSVTTAISLVWGTVAISGVTAVLTWLLRDDLVRAWARDNPDAMEQLRAGGIEALDNSSITVPSFIPLAVTSFAIIAAMALVLSAFLRGGHNWARWCLVALAAFAMFTTFVSVNRGLPLVFVLLAVLSLVLQVALLWFLFHADTRRYVRVE